MKTCLHTLIVLTFSFILTNIYAQGIGFDRMGYINGDTTSSLNVFEYRNPACKSKLVLNFELALDQNVTSGYILKLSDKKNEDFIPLSLVTSYLYNDGVSIQLNREPLACLISDTIYNEKLGENNWIKVCLYLDLNSDSLDFSIGDYRFSFSDLDLPEKITPNIRFGTSQFSEELPSFQIRNLSVVCDNDSYIFPLDEIKGEQVHTSDGRIVGKAIKPIWLTNKAYHWEKIYFHNADSIAYVNYFNNQFIIYHNDSICTLNLRDLSEECQLLNNNQSLTPLLGTSIVDDHSGKLYTYELAPSSYGMPTIASLDLLNLTWINITNNSISHQIHHHGCAYDQTSRKLYIFGGFGSQAYYNKLYQIDLQSGVIKEIKLYGDIITPRFFSSMCMWREGKVLIYGGMGNNDGSQSLGKVYYNDLYEVDIIDGHVKLLWDASNRYANQRLSPVRNMVVSEDSSSLYTMCYPVHEPDSHLKLYQISIDDGEMTERSSEVPIESKSILSNANIYYNRTNQKFYCYTQEYTPHGGFSSLTTLYTLNTPLISKELLSKYHDSSRIPITTMWIGLIIIIVLLCIVLVYFRRRNVIKTSCPVNSSLPPKFSNKNAIYLFGYFTLFDRNGKDISYMLSSKLRQMFVYLLLNSIDNNEGVGSLQLQSVLWPDKSHKSAKNLKGVFINKLRNVFEEMDGLLIVYNENNYHIEMDDRVWCDYKSYVDGCKLLKPNSKELIGIINRGKFLQFIDDDIFDPFRSHFEQNAMHFLLNVIETMFIQKRYNEVIATSKTLFSVDPTNEYALWYTVNTYKISHNIDLSKQAYSVYNDEYIRLFGEKPSLQYTDILSHPLKWIIDRR